MRGLVATVVLFVALSATAREENAGDNRPESRLLMRLLDKVERLQGELQEVRGRSDRQERELRALRRKMRELEGRGAASAAPATAADAAPTVPIVRPPAAAADATPAADAAPAAPVTQPPAAEREAPDDDVRSATRPADETPPRVQAPSSGDGEAPAVGESPAGAEAPAAAESPAAAAQAARADGARAPQPHEQRLGFLPKDAATPNERDERRAYQRATRALDDNDYALLRQELDVFLRGWPRGRYAANAKFWIGEAWYAERNLDEAEHYYKRVTEENADHQKSEDARLKLAYIHMEREQWDAAAAVLQELAQNASQGRIRALAHKKLGQVQEQER